MEKDSSKRKVIVLPVFWKMVINIYQHIAKDSPQNANKFFDGIYPRVEKITKNPTAHPPVMQFPKKKIQVF